MPGHYDQPKKKPDLFKSQKKSEVFNGVKFSYGKGVKPLTDAEKKDMLDKEAKRRAMSIFNKLPKKLQEEIKTKLLGPEARRGKTVAKKKTTTKKSGAKPSNPALYARVKAEAKRKFKVYPSAYANAWLVRTYKKRGGRYS